MIVSGNVAYLSLRPGVHHIDDKESIVNRIGAFVDEDEGRGRTGVNDSREFSRIVELEQRGAAIFPSVHPLVHRDRTHEGIIGTVDVNRVKVGGASIES